MIYTSNFNRVHLKFKLVNGVCDKYSKSKKLCNFISTLSLIFFFMSKTRLRDYKTLEKTGDGELHKLKRKSRPCGKGQIL